MTNNIFDLEQQILDCWKVTDDIEMTTKWFVDDPQWAQIDPKALDAIMNKYLAIKELYELRFNQCWQTFEQVCSDYHKRARETNDGSQQTNNQPQASSSESSQAV